MKALVSIKSDSLSSEKILKKAIEMFEERFLVTALSSVYRVERSYKFNKSVHDLRSQKNYEGMALVVALDFEDDSKKLKQELSTLEQSLTQPKLMQRAEITLLCFGEETLMEPGHVLPSPDFHETPEELIPAAELNPTWEHPVLRKNLKTLVEEAQFEAWGSFHKRAKSLLDF